MAVLDARHSTEPLPMNLQTLVAFSSLEFSSSTVYGWNTVSGETIYATGTSMTAGAGGKPSSASVTKELRFDLESDGAYPATDIDVIIRNLSLKTLLLLNSTISFWDQVLRGNDIIYAPTNFTATVFGDQFSVQGGRNVVAGNDSIRGGNVAGQTLVGDALRVGELGDKLVGGNDTILANNASGQSKIYGDVAIGAIATVIGGKDVLTGSNLRGDFIVGDLGTMGDVQFTGGNDAIYGRGGADTLFGDVADVSSGNFAGSDAVAGHDLIFGGEDNDTIYGDFRGFYKGEHTGGHDRIFGDAGNDLIFGDARSGNTGLGEVTIIYGNDRVWGGDGNDTIYGDAFGTEGAAGGHDTLRGEAGNDKLFGNGGNDQLYGGAGNDELQGGAGIDWLYGEDGDDSLYGGDDNDFLYGGAGTNLLDGGTGDDILQAQAGTANTLYGGDGNDQLHGDHGTMFGGNGDDLLEAMDSLHGVTAAGGDGNDTINGAAQGDDTIEGGRGNDTMAGFGGAPGFGIDTFVFREADFGVDTITDFVVNAPGGYDKLSFDTDVFANEAAVRAAALFDGSDTTITLGASSIKLVGVDINAMISQNFAFFS